MHKAVSGVAAQATKRSGIWSMFAGLFVALTLLLGVVVVVHFYVDYRADRTRRDTNEMLNVELARRALVADVANVTTDLMFLGRLLESLSFDPQSAEGRRRYLAEVFVTFAREKQLYDQIRFIDLHGREVVRVNLGDGEPQLVEAARLQDKSNRYYVKQALRRGMAKSKRVDETLIPFISGIVYYILLAALLGPWLAAEPALGPIGWQGALLIFGANVVLAVRKGR